MTNKKEVISILKKKVFFPVMALAIIGTALATSNFVSAQDANTESPFRSVVSKIAQKFNLNEADVQAVFDEERAEREAQMKAEMEQKLNEAVQSGKITEAQKIAIAEKFSQPFTMKFKAVKGQAISEQDVLKIKEEKKAEMDAWLKQNGLTHEILQEVIGGFKGGHGKGMMMKMRP